MILCPCLGHLKSEKLTDLYGILSNVHGPDTASLTQMNIIFYITNKILQVLIVSLFTGTFDFITRFYQNIKRAMLSSEITFFNI